MIHRAAPVAAPQGYCNGNLFVEELSLEFVSLVVSAPAPVLGSSSGAWILLLVMGVNGEFVSSSFVRIVLGKAVFLTPVDRVATSNSAAGMISPTKTEPYDLH